MKARIHSEKVKLKTYKTGKGNKAPHFIEKKQYQGACGKVYPLPVIDQILDETEDREYDMVYLENDLIAVHLLPEIGGKIYGAVAKSNGYEFIYENPVVKPALIGLCGPWVSGGVEFNWPQHHRPTTYMPMEYKLQENPDGSVTCFMGELEPLKHMRGMVAVTVRPDSTVVEAKGIVTNCTDRALPFMWWNNTAVRVHNQYKAIFPPDIEFGSDHDRRAIISFPVMKGVFETARPYDYGDGTDTTWFGNVKVPTSLMIPRGWTDMDFLGGYDYSRGAGTVMIHDHHESPGAKMFTWGAGEFGEKWCANLTDNGDHYMELMTGSYTDNQPDFAYIEPGETKEFSNYWYPVNGLGDISNASTEGAILLAPAEGEGVWRLGAAVTSCRNGLKLTLASDGKVLWEKNGALKPEEFWLEEVRIPDGVPAGSLVLSLTDAADGGEGRVLVAYRIPEKGKKLPPKPRKRAPEPEDVESIDMLYIYGRHLAQYKHGTYRPEDYYTEALRREPGDYRCNLEMGKLEMEKGRFHEAEVYLRKALERIAFEDTSPEDAESYYQMGRLMRLTGRRKEAYGYFRAAAWQYPFRAVGYFESACIDCAEGDRKQAIRKLKEAVSVNAGFFGARTLLGYLTDDRKMLEKILTEFPLDGSARYALCLLGGRPVEEFVTGNPEYVLDAALLFEKAGLYGEAETILNSCTKPSWNLWYHREALRSRKMSDSRDAGSGADMPDGAEAAENAERTKAEDAAAAGLAPLHEYLPNRLEDIAVLKNGGWRARYMLGCLYYDKENYEAAAAAWERSLRMNDAYGYTWRNLALACYDHLGQTEKALPYMRKAVSLNPEDPRLIYELMQIEKAERLPLDQRIETTERYEKQVFDRDDAWLDAAILRIQSGEYDRARRMLLAKSFHIYEGGEGKLTKYHRWLSVLEAWEAMKGGRYKEAQEKLTDALIYPLSYGEGKGYLEQDANVHYLAGQLEEKLGHPQEAENAYRKAAQEPKLVNEILFFTGLCEEKLGHQDTAEHYYQMLLAAGEEYAANPERYGYFGVGMETPLPFESDIRRNNLIKAYLLRMLAWRGLRKTAAFEGEKRALKEIDPDNPLVTILEKLGVI